MLALLAARADLDAPAVEGWQVAADVVVGLAFVVAGRFCPAPSVARGLLIGVGAAWLLGSFVPDARLWHQSVLAVFLVTFPTGRARSIGQRVVVGLAFLAMLLPPSQVLAASLFGAVVVAVILEPRDIGTARAFPIAAAVAVALVLYGSWNAARSSPESFDPVVAVSVYETVLLAVAAAVPFAVLVGLERRSRLVDRFLSDQRLVGLVGLEALLRDAAGDPTIRVYRWQAEEARYVAGDGSSSVGPSPERRWLPIADVGVPVAAVELASSALDDESTATAVASAVRLALANLDLQDELDEQLATLEAARGRLVAAGDDQREATAARLRHEVLEPLDEAASDLGALAATVHDAETSASSPRATSSLPAGPSSTRSAAICRSRTRRGIAGSRSTAA